MKKVTFSILQTGFEGECFKINPKESPIGKEVFHVITLNENSSVFDEKIKIYITSKSNSDGILMSYWQDGEVLEFEGKRKSYTEVGLVEKETILLPEKSNCIQSGQPFYNCFIPELQRILVQNNFPCKVKCLPMTIGDHVNTTVPCCQNFSSENYKCAANHIFGILQNISASDECMKPCKINEYIGKVTFKSEKARHHSVFVYYFKPPEVKTIDEEYLLYDITAVISAIGGSLGLCIGFSIRGKKDIRILNSSQVYQMMLFSI